MTTQNAEFLKLLRFVLVGISSTILYFGLVYVLVDMFSVHITLASTFVCFVAMFYNYLMHYHWTFVSGAPHGPVLLKYVLMVAGAMLINGLIVHYGITLTALHYMVVQSVAAIALICWNFCVGRFWVFATR